MDIIFVAPFCFLFYFNFLKFVAKEDGFVLFGNHWICKGFLKSFAKLRRSGAVA